MAEIGGSLTASTTKLLAGPLGVVQIGFKGYNLGKTTKDTILKPDQDIKGIKYQQQGTKDADHVRTGIEYVLSATFAEISTNLLKLLMSGLSSVGVDSMTLGRNIYSSMLDTEAGVLRVVAVDENGIPSELIKNIMNWYEAIPLINGDLIDWGNDTQREFPVDFRIKYHVFATGESSTKYGAFGYMGDPTVEDVPAAVWPDVEAPVLLTAVASSATLLTLTFDENIAFQDSFSAANYMANVNGDLVAPDSGVISTTSLALTFGAATFAEGDVITITITSTALEDTETSANAYGGIEGKAVTNTITT